LHLFVPFPFFFPFFFMLHIGGDGSGQLDEHGRVRGQAQVLATIQILWKKIELFFVIYTRCL
jgi:hypothetical protein